MISHRRLLAAEATTIVSEAFGGRATALDSSTADTFASAITSAGGSSTWGGCHELFCRMAPSRASRTTLRIETSGSYINDAGHRQKRHELWNRGSH